MPGGGIDGMISIEADCRAAIAKKFIWAQCSATIQMLAAAAAPYLATLPARAPKAGATDELLPIIGATMSSVVQTLRVFARQEETILLSGPTGAGKSRLSRWCHAQSQRHGAHFETVDLATVPEELQLAELFGW
jgi:transcriptional regulator with AAA-type ATPase domain